MIDSNQLALGGRAATAETRFRMMYPHWWGPPGQPDVKHDDAQMALDDRRCAEDNDPGHYFASPDAWQAATAAAMFWNAVRLAKDKTAALDVQCPGGLRACRDPRQVLANLGMNDLYSADTTCDDASTGRLSCGEVELLRLDSCGNHWTVRMKAIQSGVANDADHNRIISVVLDPGPCGAFARRPQ